MGGALRYAVRSLAKFGADYAATITDGTNALRNSYDLDTTFGLTAVPQQINDAMLPLLTPVFEGEAALGFSTNAFLAGGAADEFEIDHVLFYRPTANLKYNQVLGGLLTLRDNYIAAAQQQKFLDMVAGPPPNQVVMAFTVKIVEGNWGDAKYWALKFSHHYRVFI